MKPEVLLCASLAGLALLSGCASAKSGLSPLPAYMNSPEYQSRPAATESLFASDEAVLRGTTIEQILNSKVVIPKQARLAVLQHGQRPNWQWWSDEFARLDQDLQGDFMRVLTNGTRLVDVGLLPSLMIPEKQTIPYLREAAARYQADLLLVYRTASRVYDKTRAFSQDRVKAQCIVEGILLDVRTGLVPFSSVVTEEYVGKKSKEDYGFSETIAKAEMKAISLGLARMGADLVKFLEAVP